MDPPLVIVDGKPNQEMDILVGLHGNATGTFQYKMGWTESEIRYRNPQNPQKLKKPANTA